MNQLVMKKSLLKNCPSYSPDKRQRKKEKCMCPPITKKIKNSRKKTAKIKKVITDVNLLNEWAENECSRPELYQKPGLLKGLKRVSSDESVIYIGSYQKELEENTSIIDLTQQPSDDLQDRINIFHSKCLKTIYFPRNNFDRSIRLRKSMATTSLITLPVIKRHNLPRKLNSTTVLSTPNKERLALLEIPEEYLDAQDINGEFNFIEKTRLTSCDYKMIDWILDVETDLDFSLSPSTSGYNSSLDTDTSIEKMCNMYNVDSKDKLNNI